jgi:hypothetical protein
MNRFFERLQTTMAAAAFAEAGDHDTCRQMMAASKQVRAQKRVEDRVEAPRPRAQLRAPGPQD